MFNSCFVVHRNKPQNWNKTSVDRMIKKMSIIYYGTEMGPRVIRLLRSSNLSLQELIIVIYKNLALLFISFFRKLFLFVERFLWLLFDHCCQKVLCNLFIFPLLSFIDWRLASLVLDLIIILTGSTHHLHHSSPSKRHIYYLAVSAGFDQQFNHFQVTI